MIQTGFLTGRASLLLSQGCTESCPDCCLWSETLSQTYAMGMNSYYCSGCCWPQSHPTKSLHRLLTRKKLLLMLLFSIFSTYNITLQRTQTFLPFLSLLKVTTLGWLMEISIRGGLISAIFISSSSSDSSSES